MTPSIVPGGSATAGQYVAAFMDGAGYGRSFVASATSADTGLGPAMASSLPMLGSLKQLTITDPLGVSQKAGWSFTLVPNALDTLNSTSPMNYQCDDSLVFVTASTVNG